MDKLRYILLFPFLIVPFLTTSQFSDPTLLLKRSSAFLLFFIISVIFLFLKIKNNSLSSDQAKIIYKKIGFVIFLIFISYLNAVNISESYWGIIYFSGWIGIYTLFSFYSNKKIIEYLIYTTVVVGAILSIFIMNSYFDFITINFPGGQTFRATFGARNFLSQYFCFAVPASMVSIFIIKKSKNRNIFIIFFILIAITALIVRQRAAWLGILISIIIFIFINRKYIWKSLKLAINKKSAFITFLALGILLIGINLSSIDLEDKIYKQKSSIWNTLSADLKTDNNWGGRLNMYQASIQMIKEKPFFGVGLKNWRLVYPKYADNSIPHQYIRDYKFGQIRQRPHNDFLWLFSELGIFCTLFILWYIFYHLKLVYKKIVRSKKPYDRYIYSFCMVSIISIIIESMLDFPSERTIPNLYFWSIFGFISTTMNKGETLGAHSKFLKPFVLIILFFVSIASIFDIKSNFYSQKANYYNYHNKSNEALKNSYLALDYYRNLDSSGTPLFYYIGIAEYLKGNKGLAIENFSKSLKLFPYHIGSMMNYMVLLGEGRNLDKAYEVMLQIKEVYPKMAKPRLDMAKFYIQAGMHEKAEGILLNLKDEKLDDQDKTRDKLLELINFD